MLLRAVLEQPVHARAWLLLPCLECGFRQTGFARWTQMPGTEAGTLRADDGRMLCRAVPCRAVPCCAVLPRSPAAGLS